MYVSKQPRAQNRGLIAAIIVTSISALLLLAILLTLFFSGRINWGSAGSGSSSQTSIKGHPVPGIPKPNLTLMPPVGLRFNVADALAAQTVTPCPTSTVPSSALNPTPSAQRVPAQATIPVCNNGQPFQSKCYTVLPGQNPTFDQVQQSLISTANQYNIQYVLVEAIAWQESGWQENVQACDGGVGVMQLQPQTTQWLNQQNGTNYSPYTLSGNIQLGVAMVSWLYNYYLPFCNAGMPAGQTCTGDTVWPGATDGATLRDILVSAYNEGVGTMAQYGILNWQYVNNVLNLRQQFITASQPVATPTASASPTATATP